MNHLKDLKRLKKIVTVLVEEGLGYYVTKAKLHYHLPFKKRIKLNFPLSDKQRQAVRIRKSFERLGPTFIKFGQLLSLRPDLVPKEYSQEFEKLQDHVPPFPFKKAKQIIEEDLKQPLEKLFKSFEEKPFASASIAQVHKAVLNTGKKVAIKVQHPNIKETIDADLEILFYIAQSLEKHYPKIKNYQPKEIVKEFALWTRKELNFEIEAQNALRLKEFCTNNYDVKIPQIYPAYSSKNVLTMEFIEGVKIDDLVAIKRLNLNKKKLVTTYFNSILEQALIYGLFHADPHPANIFVQKNGKLVYLDYGIMGELKPNDRKKIINFINSIPEKNSDISMNLLLTLAIDVSKADLPNFKREALDILEKAYSNPIGKESYANAFYHIISLGGKYNVVFDPNHVLMAKAIYQAEGLALKLYPEFKVAEGLELFAKKYLQHQLSPLKIISEVKKTLWTKKDLLIDLPEHIAKIIKQLETPKPPQQLNVTQLKEIEKDFEGILRRKNMGMIISALIIASVILFYVEGRTHLLGIPLSIILFILALFLLIYFILTNKKKEE